MKSLVSYLAVSGYGRLPFRPAVTGLIGIGLLWLTGGPAAVGQASPAVPRDRASAEPARSVTLPFTLDHNRMMVEVEFVRKDGTVRRAQAWVDTGNESLFLAEPLARDLGYDLSAMTEEAPSLELTAPAPVMRLGGLPLRGEAVKTTVQRGPRVLPGVPAEANLPATLFLHDQVVFDYPARSLTFARPGTLEPRGIGIPCRVNAETGLFLISVTVAGDTVQLGVDNGSAGTWVSDILTTEWGDRHPDWPRATGAAGSANFFGFPFEAGGDLMRVPELEFAGLRASEVAVLGLSQRLFDWYSSKSAGPVTGFLGANVLKNFRLEIDLENEMTYWEAGPAADTGDLDLVGLTLRPEADGSVTVAGVVSRDGQPLVEGVQPGDKLIGVDGAVFSDPTLGTVVAALRGTPGSIRTLVIEREGKELAVEARVTRLP